MATFTKMYRLNKELPRYEAGSIIYHRYEVLPSRFNSGTYTTDGEYFVLRGDMKIQAISYVGEIIDRAISDFNIVADEWVTLLEEKEDV